MKAGVKALDEGGGHGARCRAPGARKVYEDRRGSAFETDSLRFGTVTCQSAPDAPLLYGRLRYWTPITMQVRWLWAWL